MESEFMKDMQVAVDKMYLAAYRKGRKDLKAETLAALEKQQRIYIDARSPNHNENLILSGRRASMNLALVIVEEME